MLSNASILEDVRRALSEDVGDGDLSSLLLPAESTRKAKIFSREPMVVAGIPWVEQLCQSIDPRIQILWQVQDKAILDESATLAYLEGPVRSLLTAERAALNFLQTLSAVATKTKAYVDRLQGTKAKLLDTRKTLPGLRYAQKYAVVCGGGSNHRMGLYDAIMIKENHIKAHGSILEAVEQAKAVKAADFVEVEVETIEEFKLALQAKPDRVLLDNFSIQELEQAVTINQCALLLEASGGISMANIAEVAATGVDYISVGDITKSLNAIDLSMLLEDEE